jgi:Spy/CpxP family protein refolding chaperone
MILGPSPNTTGVIMDNSKPIAGNSPAAGAAPTSTLGGWQKRLVISAFLGGVAAAVGVGALAEGAAGPGWGHHSALSADDSPAAVAKHVDHMLQHAYVEIEATDAQKAQLDPIVKQAVADLMPLHDQAHAAHQQALALLTADTIDRAAIENARAEHLRLADQASRRLAQLLGDVAEVLTPAQRQALAEHVQRRHGRHHG